MFGHILVVIEAIRHLKLFLINVDEVLKLSPFLSQGMVQQLMSGPLLALEITSSVHGAETPLKFRELVGPSNPVSGYLAYFYLICFAQYWGKGTATGR